MNEMKIKDHLEKAIDQAPIDLLEKIKEQPIVKMLKHDEITRGNSLYKSLKPYLTMASVAAVFLVAIINFQVQFNTVDSIIYLDVNPSIQISINKQNQVIDVEAINEDGIAIIKDLDFKRKELQLVTKEVLDQLVSRAFIKESEDIILVSVYNKKEDKAESEIILIKEVINQHLAKSNYSPIIITQAIDKSNTIEDLAKKYSISAGKMTLIRNLMLLNPNLNLDELVNLSLQDLIQHANNLEMDLRLNIEKSELKRITPSIPILNKYDDDEDIDEDVDVDDDVDDDVDVDEDYDDVDDVDEDDDDDDKDDVDVDDDDDKDDDEEEEEDHDDEDYDDEDD